MNGSSACWTTKVGTRTVGSTACTSIAATSGCISSKVPGLAARRSCRAHVARTSSFHGMSGLKTWWNSPVPHIAAAAAIHSSLLSPSVRSDVSPWPSSTTSAVVRDGCVAANSTAVGSAPTGARSDRFDTSEIVENRGDAVGPLFQSRQRTGRDRIGRSRARLVEVDEPTERCHRVNPALKGGQLRQVFAAGEPVRDEHDVPFTFSRRAIGDPQVPVHRVARLGEHCGSVSRGAR